MGLASILLSLAALGAAIMGAKYAFGPVPALYHARILARDGADPGENVIMILTVLYRVLGGALFAVAAFVAYLAIGPVRDGNFSATLIAVVAGLCVAGPATLLPFRVERATGIGTPWRVGAILAVVLLAALGASAL